VSVNLGKSWLKVTLAASALVAAFGVVTLVSAHVGPTATGVIHSCVNDSSGELKIVGETDNCKNHQTPLDWNAEGPAGPTGPTGDPGADGVSGYLRVVVNVNTGDINPHTSTGLTVDCPAGKKVLGGGGQAPADVFYVIDSYPLSDNQWFVRYQNNSEDIVGGTLTGYALCANVD
jgi:hypothetical protein